MEKEKACEILQSLIGKDLAELAVTHQIPIWLTDLKQNKGWAGHVVERCLGLPLNSLREPNLGSWELKIIPLKKLASGAIVPKETMAITMIDPVNVIQTEFEDSHLFTKMRRILIGARMVEKNRNASSLFLGFSSFELNDPEIFETVKNDYNCVRDTLIEHGEIEGKKKLTGRMGSYIQPRTKGAGHGSSSRAFYARTSFLAKILKDDIARYA